MNSTVSIIYHSRFGNNETIANLLSEILENKGYGVSVHPISEANPSEIPSSDLYVISSPTHVGAAPIKMHRFLKKMKVKTGSRFAIVATHAGTEIKTHEAIIEIMDAKGAELAADPLLLIVEGFKGPLMNKWDEQVKAWADNL